MIIDNIDILNNTKNHVRLNSNNNIEIRYLEIVFSFN